MATEVTERSDELFQTDPHVDQRTSWLMDQQTDRQPDRQSDRLDDYLLQEQGLRADQLKVARKLQKVNQGPLVMILFRLNFITAEQIGDLLSKGYAIAT